MTTPLRVGVGTLTVAVKEVNSNALWRVFSMLTCTYTDVTVTNGNDTSGNLVRVMQKLERNDLHEFEILQHVEQSPCLTNRTCASKLGVSVKLAHEILKRMVAKGMLHVNKDNPRNWQYLLTPAGLREKARLTVQFLDFSMHFYRQARRQSAAVCRDLAEAKTVRVSFLGAGDLAEIVYLGVQEWKLQLIRVYDSNGLNSRFMGQEVRGYGELAADNSDAVIVCCYDPVRPLERYLPDGVEVRSNMHWIFRR